MIILSIRIYSLKYHRSTTLGSKDKRRDSFIVKKKGYLSGNFPRVFFQVATSHMFNFPTSQVCPSHSAPSLS